MESRDAVVGRAMVELADSLDDAFDVAERLGLLGEKAANLLGLTDTCGVLRSPSGIHQVTAPSSGAARRLEVVALEAGEGPSVDCVRSQAGLVNVDLATATDRWPGFAPRAREAGYAMVHALPLRLRDDVLGAFTLFDATRRTLGEPDLAVAQALADVATISIVRHRSALDARRLNDQLSQALTSRIVIEQAKGILSQQADVGMDEAFRLLRSHARSTGRRVVDVAEDVVTGRSTASDLAGG